MRTSAPGQLALLMADVAELIARAVFDQDRECLNLGLLHRCCA